MRILWSGTGLVLTGLAMIGAVVPGMPSTVFAIGAAACFMRSSPALEARLLASRLGPSIVAWRAERAIPTSAKGAALASMLLSSVILLSTASAPAAAVTVAVMAGVAMWIVSRPAPAADRGSVGSR